MPLFGSKFSPKKGAPRRSPSLSNLNLDSSVRQEELGVDYGAIKVKLGSQEILFNDGQWISESGVGGTANLKEIQRLRRQNQQIIEENNLLKLKLEIVLDMLSERTAEVHLQENELDQFKKIPIPKNR